MNIKIRDQLLDTTISSAIKSPLDPLIASFYFASIMSSGPCYPHLGMAVALKHYFGDKLLERTCLPGIAGVILRSRLESGHQAWAGRSGKGEGKGNRNKHCPRLCRKSSL
jgi:hypothetical protein